MIIKVNNKDIELSSGSTGKDLADKLHLTEPQQALVISVNGELRDLSRPLSDQDVVEFKSFQDPEGKEVFWHTSAHVLAQAILRLWPNAQPTIGPPIEQGFYYDFANLEISENDFAKIEQEVEKILKENFKPVRIVFANKKEALQEFQKNPYKKELIEGFEGTITGYKQGEFFDLCRGPHIPNLNKIKAFKVLKTSGAYWKGDPAKEMLTRVYAISFPDKAALKEYLQFLEEAKKRDHKILGKELDLFSFQEEGPGLPFIHPKGMIIWNTLLAFWRKCHDEDNYVEIKTPMMLSKELWERSGHWFYYKENMYTSEIEKREFAIKPMNCPGGMLYYKTQVHSYRKFPMRVAEIGHVHRFEASGSLNGLFRVRGFHQDDAHLFILPSQIAQEITGILKLASKIYMTFGLSYRLELSTRPAKSIGTDEDWERATQGLKDALDGWGHSYRINEGDGAFYGPKIDLHIRDALGRYWQCGTIQLDMSLPEKFDLHYVDSDGQYKRPVMLHRTIYGSIERFLGVLIEHFAGKFPFWMSPNQIRILPVAEKHNDYAFHVAKRLQAENLIADVDDSNESVGKKVRNAQLMKYNYMLTVGDVEVQNQTISLRTRDNVVHGTMKTEDFLSKVLQEKRERALMSPWNLSQ